MGARAARVATMGGGRLGYAGNEVWTNIKHPVLFSDGLCSGFYRLILKMGNVQRIGAF